MNERTRNGFRGFRGSRAFGGGYWHEGHEGSLDPVPSCHASVHRGGLRHGGKLTDRALIPPPGIGTLALQREAFEAGLDEGTRAGVQGCVTGAVDCGPLLAGEQSALVLGIPVTRLEQAVGEWRMPSLKICRWPRFKRGKVETAVRARLAGQQK